MANEIGLGEASAQTHAASGDEPGLSEAADSSTTQDPSIAPDSAGTGEEGATGGDGGAAVASGEGEEDRFRDVANQHLRDFVCNPTRREQVQKQIDAYRWKEKYNVLVKRMRKTKGMKPGSWKADPSHWEKVEADPGTPVHVSELVTSDRTLDGRAIAEAIFGKRVFYSKAKASTNFAAKPMRELMAMMNEELNPVCMSAGFYGTNNSQDKAAKRFQKVFSGAKSPSAPKLKRSDFEEVNGQPEDWDKPPHNLTKNQEKNRKMVPAKMGDNDPGDSPGELSGTFFPHCAWCFKTPNKDQEGPESLDGARGCIIGKVFWVRFEGGTRSSEDDGIIGMRVLETYPHACPSRPGQPEQTVGQDTGWSEFWYNSKLLGKTWTSVIEMAKHWTPEMPLIPGEDLNTKGKKNDKRTFLPVPVKNDMQAAIIDRKELMHFRTRLWLFEANTSRNIDEYTHLEQKHCFPYRELKVDQEDVAHLELHLTSIVGYGFPSPPEGQTLAWMAEQELPKDDDRTRQMLHTDGTKCQETGNDIALNPLLSGLIQPYSTMMVLHGERTLILGNGNQRYLTVEWPDGNSHGVGLKFDMSLSHAGVQNPVAWNPGLHGQFESVKHHNKVGGFTFTEPSKTLKEVLEEDGCAEAAKRMESELGGVKDFLNACLEKGDVSANLPNTLKRWAGVFEDYAAQLTIKRRTMSARKRKRGTDPGEDDE